MYLKNKFCDVQCEPHKIETHCGKTIEDKYNPYYK